MQYIYHFEQYLILARLHGSYKSWTGNIPDAVYLLYCWVDKLAWWWTGNTCTQLGIAGQQLNCTQKICFTQNKDIPDIYHMYTTYMPCIYQSRVTSSCQHIFCCPISFGSLRFPCRQGLHHLHSSTQNWWNLSSESCFWGWTRKTTPRNPAQTCPFD